MAVLNLRYYKNENYYNIKNFGPYTEDIKKYIMNVSKEQYSTILENDKRTIIYNVFFEARENIIKWYDFNLDSNIYDDFDACVVKRLLSSLFQHFDSIYCGNGHLFDK